MATNFASVKTSFLPSINVISHLSSCFFEGEIILPIVMNKRNGIDPAKISGPYSLLAVMLLVAEILFAIWFYKAQSSVERTIAGFIIAVVFLSLMLLIMRINQNPEKENANRL
jgi:hypothetical protein